MGAAIEIRHDGKNAPAWLKKPQQFGTDLCKIVVSNVLENMQSGHGTYRVFRHVQGRRHRLHSGRDLLKLPQCKRVCFEAKDFRVSREAPREISEPTAKL